jgi:hypothetical protein
VFPLQVYQNEAGMFVRYNGSNDTSIAAGDRLVTINQEPTTQIANEIMGFLPGDGYHHTFRQFHLSLNFPTYYLFLKGPSYAYESGIVDTSGRFSTHAFSLRSQGKSKGPMVNNLSTRKLLSDNYRELSVLRSNKDIASLKIFGFGGSSNWYKRAFEILEKQKIRYLILDLRGNSGGNLFNANQLLSYLLPDTFSMCFRRRDNRIRLDGRSNMSFAMRATIKLFSWLPSKRRGMNPTCQKQGEWLVNRFYFEPAKKFRFTGKIVVLMDGGTFSAATLVAAQLRKKLHVKLLGEETGGGARGSYAMVMPTLTLPNTRMR